MSFLSKSSTSGQKIWIDKMIVQNKFADEIKRKKWNYCCKREIIQNKVRQNKNKWNS